jgi:uncharacterized protein (DUF952 family)
MRIWPVPPIYHLIPAAAWQGEDPYQPASLATEGFVHCSYADQVERVANLFFGDALALLALILDVGRLTSPVRDEDAGTGERFPHVHGPIDRAAVVEVRPLRRGADGRWVLA